MVVADNQLPEVDLKMWAIASQAVAELAGPIILGVVVGYWTGYMAVAVVIGTCVGFLGTFIHLILIANRMNRPVNDYKPPESRS
jgi:hypothetical protein